MKKRYDQIKLGLLLTGNEVVAGDVLDTNSSFIAKEFAAIGLNVEIKVAVTDHLEHIAGQIAMLSERLDILIVNGGLGNTVDDLTAQAASMASGRELLVNENAVLHVSKKLGIPEGGSPERLGKQVMIPEESNLIDNPKGTALGFSFLLNECSCYYTPGVPAEMQVMMREGIIPEVVKRFGLTKPIALNRLHVLGIGEYRLQQWIEKKVGPKVLEKIQLGFRAASPNVEVKLGISKEEDRNLLDETTEEIQGLFSDYIYSENETLPFIVNHILRDQGQTVTLAESCTGGLITSYLVAIPGASDILGSSVVSYSYHSKTKLLGVDALELENQGAVSDTVVEAMVEGALELSDADYGVAVSGIAGPGGGTKEKPVGTVYIGWGKKGEIHHRRLIIHRERADFQHVVACTAIDLLRRYLLGLPTDAPYYFDALSRDQLQMRIKILDQAQ